MTTDITENNHQEMLKKIINESRWNPKTCSHNTQKIKERDTVIRTVENKNK